MIRGADTSKISSSVSIRFARLNEGPAVQSESGNRKIVVGAMFALCVINGSREGEASPAAKGRNLEVMKDDSPERTTRVVLVSLD
jgi:hypothetical protein